MSAREQPSGRCREAVVRPPCENRITRSRGRSRASRGHDRETRSCSLTAIRYISNGFPTDDFLFILSDGHVQCVNGVDHNMSRRRWAPLRLRERWRHSSSFLRLAFLLRCVLVLPSPPICIFSRSLYIGTLHSAYLTRRGRRLSCLFKTALGCL